MYAGNVRKQKLKKCSFVLALLIANCIRRILNVVGWGGGGLLRGFSIFIHHKK